MLSVQPRHHDNTIEGARQNIHQHYDLSNDLFRLFLDESLTYSSAIFDGEPHDSPEDLATAQRRKIDRLLDAAGVRAGTRLLEIGTGWGELAMRAAGRGADVTTLTISTEQAALARERIAAAGHADRVRVLLQDYREVTGRFDAVVSVEMIEAVGANHWNDVLRDHRPGARAGRPGAGCRRSCRTTTPCSPRRTPTPGSASTSSRAGRSRRSRRSSGRCAAHTPLRIADRYSFGRHYAETLHRWRTTFEARAAEVDALGFDETFRRMWSLYLAYSEAGFRTGYLDVAQFTLTK